eukprot:352544-Chlamydomonas_euryale.AAC.19
MNFRTGFCDLSNSAANNHNILAVYGFDGQSIDPTLTWQATDVLMWRKQGRVSFVCTCLPPVYPCAPGEQARRNKTAWSRSCSTQLFAPLRRRQTSQARGHSGAAQASGIRRDLLDRPGRNKVTRSVIPAVRVFPRALIAVRSPRGAASSTCSLLGEFCDCYGAGLHTQGLHSELGTLYFTQQRLRAERAQADRLGIGRSGSGAALSSTRRRCRRSAGNILESSKGPVEDLDSAPRR